MSRLRQRLRAHRRCRARRLYLTNLFERLCVALAPLFVILALVFYISDIPTTYSSFTARAEVGPISFSAGTWHISIDDAAVRIHPETLNPSSGGQWVTAYIGLDPVDVADIDVSTVRLEYKGQAVHASWGNLEADPVFGYVLMVKFDRALVSGMLEGVVGEVDLAVTGEGDGFSFTGSDSIRVLLCAKVSLDVGPEALDVDVLAEGTETPRVFRDAKLMGVTGSVELPDGYDVSLIDVRTVRLEYGEHSAGVTRSEVQGSCLFVAFDWPEICAWFEGGDPGDLLLTVTGEVLVDEVTVRFAGSDYLGIPVEEEASVLALYVAGPDALSVPGVGEEAITQRYDAIDDSGNTVVVTWSILEPIEGVDVDEEGIVTVTEVASGGFTLIATLDGMGLTAEMDVCLLDPVPAEDQETEEEPGGDELEEVDVKEEDLEGISGSGGDGDATGDDGADGGSETGDEDEADDEAGIDPEGESVARDLDPAEETREIESPGDPSEEPAGDVGETGDMAGGEGLVAEEPLAQAFDDAPEQVEEEAEQESVPGDDPVETLEDVAGDTGDDSEDAEGAAGLVDSSDGWMLGAYETSIDMNGLSASDVFDPGESWTMGNDHHLLLRREEEDETGVDKP